MEETINAEQEVAQTLAKTDLGDFVLKYKKQLLSALVLVFLTLIAYTIFKSNQASKIKNSLNLIETFKTDKIEAFKAKKMEVASLISAVTGLDASLLKQPLLAFYLAEVANDLIKEQKWDEASQLLKPSFDHLDKSTHLGQLYAFQLAVMQENAGKVAEAIKTLEQLLKAPKSFVTSKLYFDLGRLYLAQNNTNQAKLNFEYVLKEAPQSELAQFAAIYLKELPN
jgi:predicted negative regulator of RcsB-dependent stress response